MYHRAGQLSASQAASFPFGMRGCMGVDHEGSVMWGMVQVVNVGQLPAEVQV